MFQTQDGKRTALAEVKIALEIVEEELINRKEVLRRVKPEQVDFFLHPQLDTGAMKEAKKIASGLNVSLERQWEWSLSMRIPPNAG